MFRTLNSMSDNKGAVLIAVVFVLTLLILMGISLAANSTIEVQISGNERVSEIAFYRSESGWKRAVAWLDVQVAGITEDLGSDTGGGGLFSSAKADNPDALASGYSVDIDFDGTTLVPGYSTDFRSYLYTIDSTGTGPMQARCQVRVLAGRVYSTGGY